VTKRVLHAGCGGSPLPPWPILAGTEVRLDIDPRCKPDIVASITDLGDIGEFDFVFSSHCLEHLHPADGQKALREFRRVLKVGGLAIILVPNLEGIQPTEEVIYQSPAGPITGLDMYFGHRGMTEHNPYMAHRTGFVAETLAEVLTKAGFFAVRVVKDEFFNLHGYAAKGAE